MLGKCITYVINVNELYYQGSLYMMLASTLVYFVIPLLTVIVLYSRLVSFFCFFHLNIYKNFFSICQCIYTCSQVLFFHRIGYILQTSELRDNIGDSGHNRWETATEISIQYSNIDVFFVWKSAKSYLLELCNKCEI